LIDTYQSILYLKDVTIFSLGIFLIMFLGFNLCLIKYSLLKNKPTLKGLLQIIVEIKNSLDIHLK
jgi:hypothetical protein